LKAGQVIRGGRRGEGGKFREKKLSDALTTRKLGKLSVMAGAAEGRGNITFSTRYGLALRVTNFKN
jgi:hypothetical protein